MKGFCYKGSSKYLYVKPLTTTYSPFFLFTFLLQQEIILPSLAILLSRTACFIESFLDKKWKNIKKATL